MTPTNIYSTTIYSFIIYVFKEASLFIRLISIRCYGQDMLLLLCYIIILSCGENIRESLKTLWWYTKLYHVQGIEVYQYINIPSTSLWTWHCKDQINTITTDRLRSTRSWTKERLYELYLYRHNLLTSEMTLSTGSCSWCVLPHNASVI